MSTQYELIYFPVVGRAETSKALLTIADASWKYTTVTFEEWPAIKSTTPFGHLPILHEFDPATGEKAFEVAESSAIETYLATKFGLNGKTLQETTLISSVRSADSDIRELALRYMTAVNEDAKTKALEKYMEASTNLAACLDKFIANNPTGSGYFVGDSLTIVDITAYISYIWSHSTGGHYSVTAEKTPHLLKLIEKVKKHPKLEAFFADFEQRVHARVKARAEKEAAEKVSKEATTTK
ncbi:hypothetical protein GQ42DRAFT_161497 [Ramicandelaber brevisporus]|nr:hypothetical protein GQ42DRAFT_161497 [Ramicandelaber brevisporus]